MLFDAKNLMIALLRAQVWDSIASILLQCHAIEFDSLSKNDQTTRADVVLEKTMKLQVSLFVKKG